MPHRNPVRPSDVRHFPRSLSISRPSRQSRSRPTLYAVRYAPGGRGRAITKLAMYLTARMQNSSQIYEWTHA